MVHFLSAGLGLGHKDVDGYMGRLRSTRVLWWLQGLASRKHLRTKVTPDFHLTYSKNGGNLGSESKS